MKEFVVRIKAIYFVDVIVEADAENEAIQKVINGEGNRGEILEKVECLHPRTWEILEL